MIEIEIPDNLKIGGHEYKIQCSQEEDAILDAQPPAGWWGRHSEANRIIVIHSKASPTQQSRTFLEEAGHAINNVYSGNAIEHDKVKDYAEGLLQLFEQLGVRFVKSGGPKVELEA